MLFVAIPRFVLAEPKVAIAPLDGDDGGKVSDVVAEAASERAKVTRPARVEVAMRSMGVSVLSAKTVKKLRAKLDVDVVVYGSVERDGGSKRLSLSVDGGGNVKRLEVDFKTPKDLKKDLGAKLAKRIGGAMEGNGDDEEDDDEARRREDEKRKEEKRKREEEEAARKEEERRKEEMRKREEEERRKEEMRKREEEEERKRKKRRGDDDEDEEPVRGKRGDDEGRGKRGDDDERSGKRGDDDDDRGRGKRDDDDERGGVMRGKRGDDDDRARGKRGDDDDDRARGKRGDDDERGGVMRSKRGDDDDDRRGKRGDDDDDRRGKRVADEDDEDDNRARKRFGDEDDEDLDDEDDEDRGKRRKKRGKRHVLTQTAVWLDAGGAFERRTLTYDATGNMAPPPVGTAAPAGRLEGELYPGAFSSVKSIGAGFGVYGHYTRAFALGIRVPGTQVTAPVKSADGAIGARYRFAFGQHSLALGVAYWKRYFLVDRMGQTLDMPDVNYTAIAPGLAVRIGATPKIAAFATFDFPLMLFSGPIQDPVKGYGSSKILAFDLRGGVQYVLAKHVALQVGLELDQVGLSFTKQVGSMSVTRNVSKATDRSIGLAATVGVNY